VEDAFAILGIVAQGSLFKPWSSSVSSAALVASFFCRREDLRAVIPSVVRILIALRPQQQILRRCAPQNDRVGGMAPVSGK
jgi:hypothetical protein